MVSTYLNNEDGVKALVSPKVAIAKRVLAKEDSRMVVIFYDYRMNSMWYYCIAFDFFQAAGQDSLVSIITTSNLLLLTRSTWYIPPGSVT